MTETTKMPVIGYTIAEGNPVDGFAMYGFFQTEAEAIAATEDDSAIGFDWWLMPIYRQTTGA
jgi:hypothetical protein